MLTRWPDERDRVESCDDRRCMEDGSSVIGDTCTACDVLGAAGTLLSDLECGLRLGGGAGFLGSGGTGAVVAACEALGGVGGRGAGIASTSVSVSTGSGTLPAASRSNMLSLPSSIERRAGAAGSGLFTSDGVEGRRLDEVELPPGELGAALGLEDEDGLKIASIAEPVAFSFERSILITFPWRELGGGGFFLRVEIVCCVFACGLLISPMRSSSPSASDISCDVLGVSCKRLVSNMDCRDTDDASVMLAASAACKGVLAVPGLDAEGSSIARGVLACPVMSSRWKASTSSKPVAPAEGLGVPETSSEPCSISSSVFLNGFGGGPIKAGGTLVGTL